MFYSLVLSTMQKLVLISIVFLSLIGSTFALDTDPIVQTKLLLDQYGARVKTLENENTILREEMRKAGIQIPLSLFSSAIQTVASTGSIVASGNNTGTTMSTGTVITTSGEVSYSAIEKTYGVTYTGFIKRIISEWSKVRDAYAMPKNAYIGGYEFVTTGALDHVFVDIIYTGSVSGTGIFDAKILYQFDKTTYARKLIGLFEYNAKTGYYVTKTGKNIFPGVKRTWIADPRASTGAVTVPNTVVAPTQIPAPTGGSAVLFSDIETAYTAKRFLSVISLSNTWLASNTPTLEVLRIRYRTYFIIAKYPEALKEIEKIRSLGQLTSAVACE
jgi:hypothetical protein